MTHQELALSNALSQEALVRVLIRRGLLTEEEILDELATVKSEWVGAQPARQASTAMSTPDLVQEARSALRTLEKELARAEYLATADLPQAAHLQEPLREHVERLAAGLVALAKAEFRATGVYVPDSE